MNQILSWVWPPEQTGWPYLAHFGIAEREDHLLAFLIPNNTSFSDQVRIQDHWLLA